MGSAWREILNPEKGLTKLTKASVDQAEPTEANPSTIAAMRLMNVAGCRIIRDQDELRVGVWSDVDGPEIRTALRSLGMQSLPVVHLESADVDVRYKVRHCPDRDKGESFRVWLQRAEITFTKARQR